MKNLDNNTEVISQLAKFNLWGKDGKNSELLFTGTHNECTEELKENYDESHPDFEVFKNTISDQWENEVDGIGYVKFANGEIIDYSL